MTATITKAAEQGGGGGGGRPVAVLPKTRVTVQERVYHQSAGDQPTLVEHQFERVLRSDDQPYQHKTKITEDWRPLGESWIERASIVLIKNTEGRFPSVNPTPQERVVAERKIVEVGVLVGETVVPMMLVLPNECVRFTPIDFSLIRVRCRHGMACCVVSLMPE